MELSVTIIIVAVTALVSLQAFNNHDLFQKLVFNAYVINERKEYWRLLSHSLLHGSLMHLGVNMFVLWNFGTIVERTFDSITGGMGTVAFLGLYVGAVLFSSLPALQKHKDNPMYNAVGASGGTSALVVAFGLLYPFEMLVFPPLPGILFVFAFIAYEHYMDKRSSDNVAHDAHLFGALFGIAFTLFLDPGVIRNITNGLQDFLN